MRLLSQISRYSACFTVAAVAAFTLPSGASATTITLDFDTAATGLNIVSSPLSTSAGTITASASGSSSISVDTGGGFTGNGLRHNQNTDNDFAQLAFDFDATSVTFNYVGLLSGAFTAQILDSAVTVLGSFTDNDTDDDLPGGPTTLSGSGIRFFRFSDSPSASLTLSGVDNVQIAVPIPTTIALVGLGLAGLGYRRKQIKAS